MSEKQKKGNGFKIVIILLLSLVIVGGAAFAGMYFLGNKNSTPVAAKVVKINEATYSLDEFVVNLVDDGGLMYLKTTVYIGYEENSDLTAEITKNLAIIRDVVNVYLRSKKNADFSDTGIVAIKKDLIIRLNPILTKGKILNIYFNSIVISR